MCQPTKLGNVTLSVHALRIRLLVSHLDLEQTLKVTKTYRPTNL